MRHEIKQEDKTRPETPAAQLGRFPAAKPLSSTEAVKRILWQHIVFLGPVALYVLLIPRCPILWFFGIPCPGCGLTRAHLLALQGEWAAALHMHPVFFLVIPLVLYLAHQKAWHLPGERKTRYGLLIGAAIAFVAAYVYRLCFQPDPGIRIEWEQSVLYRVFEWIQTISS